MQQTPIRHGRDSAFVPLLIAGAFLAVGLITLEAYGTSWDEPLHRDWGRILWQYLRSGDAGLLDELEGAGQYYGPLYYIINYGVSELAHGTFGLGFPAANHVLNVITASVGVWFTFLLARTLANSRAAVAAATAFVLLPHFVAHAHYNPKDIPLMTLAAATLLLATKAYRSARIGYAAGAGALLGVAIAMKPTAGVLLPIIAGAIALDWWSTAQERRLPLRTLAALTLAGAAASVLGLFGSWPTLWRQPMLLVDAILYFGRGSFWDGNVLYFGETTLSAELPWHYTLVMLFLATPLAISALSACGAARMIDHIAKRTDVFAASLVLLWLALPLLLFMKPGLSRYDGMRQLFLIVPAIAIVSGIGWDALYGWLQDRGRAGRAFIAATALAVSWLVVENVRAFPYGGSYVNAAVRRVAGPHLERQFELEYWGVSYREGLQWLRERHTGAVCVPLAGKIVTWELADSPGGLVHDCAGDPGYVMLMTRFAEWPDEYQSFRDRPPAFTVSRLGSDLLYVYPAE